MRKTLIALAITALAMTGCGGSDPEPEFTGMTSTEVHEAAFWLTWMDLPESHRRNACIAFAVDREAALDLVAEGYGSGFPRTQTATLLDEAC